MTGAEIGGVSLGTAIVLLPCTKERPGKIRLELGGQEVDMTATTGGPPIPAGALVAAGPCASRSWRRSTAWTCASSWWR